MLMRKTSAPALNRSATTARSAEAGPRVAMILTRRLRRITNVLSFLFGLIFSFVVFARAGVRLHCALSIERGGRSRVGGIGELNGPVLGVLAGVDLEEAGAI